jgi:hypothetical protein
MAPVIKRVTDHNNPRFVRAGANQLWPGGRPQNKPPVKAPPVESYPAVSAVTRAAK